MSEKHFCSSLRYTSPAHGGWGVVRMGMLVPESYQLFVCPFACGRHGAIGAIHQGYKNRVSYLYISESDIVSGDYESLIPNAVDELLRELKARPKALMIFVSCLDDLLGTDHEAFLETLREKYKDISFTVCHMNPITLDGKVPPPVNIQRKMYGLLKPKMTDKRAVNLIGNLVDIDRESEIYRILLSLGFERVNHISNFKTFEDFQKMAEAGLNVVVDPKGLIPAKDMEKELHIPYVFLPVTYDLNEIEKNYLELYAASGSDDLPEFMRSAKADALTALSKTREALNGLPLIIDGSSTVRPFSMARLFLSFGFNVTAVYGQELSSLEKPHYDWLSIHAPGLSIIQPEHHLSPKIRKTEQDCLAIGFEGAYLSGASYAVSIAADEELYGYHGIALLCRKISAAARGKTDLRAMIHDYGLVV